MIWNASFAHFFFTLPQETLKVLQNQNKFLNDEVMKLAKLRQQDAVKLQVSWLESVDCRIYHLNKDV